MSVVDRRIAENLAAVQDRIAGAAGGRDVTLVCVTKYAGPEWVEALLEAGATDLGENRLPEGLQKLEVLRAMGRTLTSHLIGPLQSRKAPLAARFDWYQALETLEVARKLNEKVPSGRLNVLVQVNIAGESQKHGVAPEQLAALLEGTVDLSNLRLRGLMCIPPGPESYASATEFERGTRAHFRQMRRLFDTIAGSFPEPPDTLSMGMSQDFAWAIEEGSTMVRVGSALFRGLSE